LPPGQYLTERFPVLHVGDVPTYQPGDWDLKIFGLVDKPFTINLDELKSMPAVTLLTDIHCVTKWSKFDTTWKGVRVRDLFERAGMQKDAGYIMGHAEHGYTANLPLADVLLDESLVVYEYEGEVIEPIHGGPVRLLVPHLYFWKSPKWLRGLELRATDAPGFWEQNGYNMYGDPFLEQRFWGD
jgi:DMSO/TMAO reductase YedYZ molybdopterin-dependent catalytic subunit